MGGLQGTWQGSLRSEIETLRREHGYTLSKLGELTGINPGSLSEILNGNPPRAMTIGQLDSLAAVFGQEPGWLYEFYTEECLSEGRISRPRLIPYLIRCAEVGRQDCIESAVSQLLDNPKNIAILFLVGEQLFDSGRIKESIPFYQGVIESEKDGHSDQFVKSQYRLFRATLGTNAEENVEAVIRFSPYRNRLPENYQLDALFHLARVCFALQKWKKSEQYADELRFLAETIYIHELDKLKRNKISELPDTERPLVYYYAMGHLFKGATLEMQGMYAQAKQYVQSYADLGWFEVLDEAGHQEVERFRVWANANLYTLEVLAGNTNIIGEYADYLESLPTNEILPGLVSIMKSANTYDFCVDELLTRFSSQISNFGQFTDAIRLDRHLRFRYQTAIYEIGKGRIVKGIDEMLRCLSLAVLMNRFEDALKCVALFEEYRQHASPIQVEQYQALVIGSKKGERSFSD